MNHLGRAIPAVSTPAHNEREKDRTQRNIAGGNSPEASRSRMEAFDSKRLLREAITETLGNENIVDIRQSPLVEMLNTRQLIGGKASIYPPVESGVLASQSLGLEVIPITSVIACLPGLGVNV